MDRTEFENEYPDIASLLGSNFWSNVEAEHSIKFNLLRDNTRYLDYLSRLVNLTPATEITSQYQNDLYDAGQFKAFFSEMVGYIATDRWLCSSPDVLDIQGTSGLPEFGCEDFDVEVARILEAQEIERVRAHLEKELDGDCIAFVEKKRQYDNYASGNPAWAETEEQVQELLDEIGNIDADDIPLKVETDALRVQIEEAETDNVGYFGRSSMRRIIPDEDEKIARTIRQKAHKCRDDRPLVVFLDLEITSVDCLQEVITKTIGASHAYAFPSDVEISKHIEETDPAWDDYLIEIGAIPGGSNQAIPPGNEGVFASEEVSCIAGAMVRLCTGEVVYVPNVYTDEVDAKSVFDRLGWRTDTRTLKPNDI